jgi:hypothetical protein
MVHALLLSEHCVRSTGWILIYIWFYECHCFPIRLALCLYSKLKWAGNLKDLGIFHLEILRNTNYLQTLLTLLRWCETICGTGSLMLLCPSPMLTSSLSTSPTWIEHGRNANLHCKKPASNCLSYGTAVDPVLHHYTGCFRIGLDYIGCDSSGNLSKHVCTMALFPADAEHCMF